ncbi:MAG: TlpA family protein disulfide reductase [Niabella sp.]
MQQEDKKKKLFSASNIITTILILFAAGMLLFPNFKAVVLQGLMKVGLFQPSVNKVDNNVNTKRNWDISFANSSGLIVDSSSIKGKVVFINIWATWCPPCIAEMPSVNKLYNQYKSNPNISFLLIDADNNFLKSEEFMQQKGYSLPVHISNKAIPKDWFNSTLPTTIVLNKKGNMVYRHAGVADYGNKDFEKFITGLLNE